MHITKYMHVLCIPIVHNCRLQVTSICIAKWSTVCRKLIGRRNWLFACCLPAIRCTMVMGVSFLMTVHVKVVVQEGGGSPLLMASVLWSMAAKYLCCPFNIQYTAVVVKNKKYITEDITVITHVTKSHMSNVKFRPP